MPRTYPMETTTGDGATVEKVPPVARVYRGMQKKAITTQKGDLVCQSDL